jgi:serine/threonine-protein phosphatase 2A activator
VGFVESLNEAVRGKPLSSEITLSPVVLSIVEMLEEVDKLVDETELTDQPQRFGNVAFADFYRKLVNEAPRLLKQALPEKFHKAIPEMAPYLNESMGNSTRIDYGTGHELAFVMFMYCLFRTGALDCNSKDDK